MSISSNYGLLQKQIADECSDNQALLAPLSDNSGLASPIQNAIQSAITQWEREPFYFNGYRLQCNGASTFVLQPGQEYYTSADFAPLANLAAIKSLTILQGSQNRFTLDERTSIYLDENAVNLSWRRMPTDYAFDAMQLRIYPIPDTTYPVGILGTLKLAPLAADADSNAWTTEAFDLIRCTAKLILGRDVLYDEQIETAARRAVYGTPDNPKERGYYYDLKAETTRRNSTRTRTTPTNF